MRPPLTHAGHTALLHFCFATSGVCLLLVSASALGLFPTAVPPTLLLGTLGVALAGLAAGLWLFRAQRRLEQTLTTLSRRLTDLTAQHERAQTQLSYVADHDALTGALNRRRFQAEAERWIQHSLRYARPLSLLVLDLDHFRFINESLGHPAGDRFLAQVAARLQQELRETDVLGRLGADEFGILLTETGVEEAQATGQRLLGRLGADDIDLDGRLLTANANIGLALCPAHGEYYEVLLRHADIALHRAKRAGRNRVHLFEPSDAHGAEQARLRRWEDRLKRAFKDDRLFLMFQPIHALGTDPRAEHYEVLLRLRDLDGATVAPGEFLPTAERFGLIEEIDRRVVRLACETQAALRRQGREVALSINLSGCEFNNPAMCADIARTIRNTGADPSRLVFEITETNALANLTETQQFIHTLRAEGCRFALDDFGAGFTSLSHLKHIPIDILKIDGSFVQRLDQNPRDQVVVKAVTEMAHAMDLEVTAEFVENEATLALLKQYRVDHAQGYHLGRPALMH